MTGVKLHKIPEKKTAEKKTGEKNPGSAQYLLKHGINIEDESYLNLVGVMIVVLDANGKVCFINKAGAGILGHERDWIIGRDWFDDFIPEPVRDEIRAVFARNMAGGHGFIARYENPVLANGGVEKLIRSNNTLIVNEKGEIAGALSVGEDITDIKKTQDELRLQSAIISNMTEGVNLVRASDAAIVYTNPKFDEMFGYETGELEGKNISTVNAPSRDPQLTAAMIMKSLKETGEWHGEVHNIKKDGTMFWCYASVSFFRHPKYGDVLISIHTDINEKRKAEEALAESAEKFRMVYQNLPVPYQSLDENGNFFDINQKWCNVLGYQRDEVIGRNFAEFLAPGFDELFRVKFPQFKAAGEVCNVPFRMIRKDGTDIFVEFFGRVGYDVNGGFERTHCVFQDITARMRVEGEKEEFFEKLQKSENLFRTIYESSNVGIMLANSEGKIITANPSVEKMFGYSEDELLNLRFSDISHPGELEHNLRLFSDVVKGTLESYHIEKRYFRKDGGILWGDLVVSAVRDGIGKFQYCIAVVEDITERKNAEEDIRLHETRLQSLLNLNKMTGASEKEIMDFVNDEAVKITNSKYAFIGLVSNDESTFILHAYSREVMDECMTADKPLEFSVDKAGVWADAIRQKKHMEIDDYNAPLPSKKGCPEGHVKITRILSVPVFDGDRVVALACVANKEKKYNELDVNALKSMLNDMWRLISYKRSEKEKIELWNQLLQSQKIESVGRLAGGIAHDFNNVLTGILGYGELALRDLPEGHPAKGKVNIIIESGLKAASLTRQLLAFSRKQLLTMRLNNLNEIIDNMARILNRVIGEDIRLEFNTGAQVKNVMVDDTQIEQVLMNLVVNARDAMPHGGRLTIETQDVDLDETYVMRHPDMKPGSYVMLSVTDTGVGMSREIQEKMFEPFFTTKEKEKGTGLGLSTVFGIVKQHGGFIWAYSEPGKGSLFRIYLPAVKGKLKTDKKKRDSEIKRGLETILIVDDDEVIRNLTRETLEPLGYKVLEAKSGEDAIVLCDTTAETIDLMITDVIMTGISGWELAEVIRAKIHGISVIFTSGYLDNPIVLENIMQLGMPFVNKPFTPGVISKKIRETLDSKSDEKKP